MSTPIHALVTSSLALSFLLLGSACSNDSFKFYDVTRTPTSQCDILPQGLFCNPQLDPPVQETWAIERTGTRTFVYVDDVVWVVDAPAANAPSNAPLVATTQEVVTKDPGPCTTTSTANLTFTADDTTFTGTLNLESRLDGPSACGNVPSGQKRVESVAGARAPAP